MLKKIGLLSVLFLGCTHAFAEGNIYLAPSAIFQSVTSNDDSSFSGISPRIALGYGAYFPEGLYLAGEASVIIGTATLSDHAGDDGTSIKTTRSYGISILPGYEIFKNSLAYLRGGLVYSNFDDHDTNAYGAQLGVGLETQLTENWQVRTEYIYTNYISQSDIGSPTSNAFLIGFVHTFG